MKYTLIHDPGHGWLKVPTRDLQRLGIDRRISKYSYLSPSGTWTYLEEDVDAGLFIEAWYRFFPNEDPEIVLKHVDHDAGCRSYRRYDYKDAPEYP